MASTFGDEYRMVHKCTRNGIQCTYLFFYNLAQNLPVNLNVTHVIEVTPSHLKTKKRLFWRGDVVMKVQPKPEEYNFIVESLDADLSDLRPLEQFLREAYQEGELERRLNLKESQWNSYLKHRPTLWASRFSTSYWGTNAAEREENFLQDLNELRCALGHRPLPRPAHMKSYTEHAVALYGAFKSTFRLHTRPPKLPQELERQIFEMCALGSPDFCTVLVLVARRVHAWIDPILIATVCMMDGSERDRRPRPELFLAKLTNGKPIDYYAQHIKNLAILGGSNSQPKTIDRILTICTGVQNLVLFTLVCDIDFFKILDQAVIYTGLPSTCGNFGQR